MSQMTWDEIDTHNFSRTGNIRLSTSTMGCGCCSDGISTDDVTKAVAIVKEYIAERQQEIADWEQWLSLMEKSDKLIDFHNMPPRSEEIKE